MTLAAEAGKLADAAGAQARAGRRRRHGPGVDARDGRSPERLPLPRRPVGAPDLRPRALDAPRRGRRPARWSPRSSRSTSGGSASFVIETRNLTTTDAEERVERQAREFELLKPYLVERWQAADGAHERRSRCRRAVLIPVANPLTAEELVRIGASLMDPRTGELTALGIVEVPEGMPLSEGATRARQARRLLQKVLDYVPEGTVIHPLVRIGRHAAAGHRRGGRRAGSGPHDLRLGRQVRRPTATRTPRSSRPPSTRSCASRRATSRSSSSAAPATSGGSSSPSAAARTPSSRCEFADALAHRHDATVAVMHVVPSGVTEAVRAQAEHALAAFVAPARRRPAPSRSCARRPTSGPRSCARPSAPTSSSWARRRRPASPGTSPVRRPAGGDRPAGQADGDRRQDPRADRPPDVRAARPAGRDPGRRRPRRRGVARGPGPRRALVRRVQLPPLRVRRPRAASPRSRRSRA